MSFTEIVFNSATNSVTSSELDKDRYSFENRAMSKSQKVSLKLKRRIENPNTSRYSIAPTGTPHWLPTIEPCRVPLPIVEILNLLDLKYGEG